MKYFDTGSVVEAVKWTGRNYEEIEAFIEQQYVIDIPNNVIMLCGVTGNEYVQAGDYIIKSNGTCSHRERYHFEKKYQMMYEG